MTDVLIRNLDDKLVKELESAAESSGRSLESEIRRILHGAAKSHMAESRRISVHWRNRLWSSSQTTDNEGIRHERV